MDTLDLISDEVRGYNRVVAYGSECNAWQDFVADCYKQYGIAPWDDAAADTKVSDDFADYWIGVASGNSNDYAENGGRRHD